MRYALALLSVALLSAAWLTDRAGVEQTPMPADVIVVLGARVDPDGSPSETLRARTEHAALLYRKGFAPKLLFSGGIGTYGPSEASVAARHAQSLGIPAEDCLLEEDSHSTAENAAFTAKLISGKTIIVVTDPYHLPRALELFRRQGVPATGSPVLEAPRHRNAGSRIFWTLREVAARARLLIVNA